MEGLENLQNAIDGINAKSEIINANEVEVKSLKEDLEAKSLELKSTKEEIVKLGTEVAKMKESQKESVSAKNTLAKDIEEKGLKLNGGEIELKAVQDYSDLTQTGQLDQVDNTISRIAVKTPVIPQLFRRIPMVTETYSYMDQTSAVRDASGVAKCSTGFTSLTKEEIGLVRTNDVLIKDTLDICLDYASDYSFVTSSAQQLIGESLLNKIDSELFLGTDSATSTASIDSVSSEFSATNPAAPVDGDISDANFADLLAAMKAQIFELGKQNKFAANVAVVNYMDYFKLINSAKNAQSDYLNPRVTMVGENIYVDGLLIVPHTECTANTCYVFDASKGAILDRRSYTLQMSTENGTNFVDGFGTMLATARIQFLVKNNDSNAFMKCSDVATAIAAITAA